MAGCQAPPVNAGRFPKRSGNPKSEIRNPKFLEVSGQHSEFRIPNSEFTQGSPILGRVIDSLLPSPLARWDGLHLTLDLVRVERHLNEWLSSSDRIGDISLQGEGDALAAEATVTWKGIAARVGLELAEIRLRDRFLGFRMRRLRALGGIPVPRAAVELGLRSLESPLLKVFPGQGIVVVDLRKWLPDELDLRILTVQGAAHWLAVWFGPGRLDDLPQRGQRRLPAET